MRVTEDDRGVPVIELSRRNLTVLLAKLDSNKEHPGSSACTIGAPDRPLWVKAVEDEEHYSDRPPGGMLVRGEII